MERTLACWADWDALRDLVALAEDQWWADPQNILKLGHYQAKLRQLGEVAARCRDEERRFRAELRESEQRRKQDERERRKAETG